MKNVKMLGKALLIVALVASSAQMAGSYFEIAKRFCYRSAIVPITHAIDFNYKLAASVLTSAKKTYSMATRTEANRNAVKGIALLMAVVAAKGVYDEWLRRKTVGEQKEKRDAKRNMDKVIRELQEAMGEV